MKYLIFAYGEYKNNNKIVKGIVNQLIPIASDVNLKYSYGDQSMIVAFDSDLDFEHIKKYVTFVISQTSAMYFLMPCTDKMSYSVPDDMMELFFGENEELLLKYVDEVSENDIDNIFNNLTENDFEDTYEEEDTLEQILKQSKQIKKTEVSPTLDEILDKISENGVSSLTTKERQVLDSYSKQ